MVGFLVECVLALSVFWLLTVLVGGSVKGVSLLLFLGLVVGGLRLFLSSSRYLSTLVVLESLKVLLLGCCLLGDVSRFRVGFVSLLVMFTLEAVLGLVVLVRI